MVDTPGFEWMILVLIFASSITLCFEDIYLDDNPFLKKILYWTNLGFCALFSFEMLLKWLALGFCKYFTSFWTILDFIIVFVSRTANPSAASISIVCVRLRVCAPGTRICMYVRASACGYGSLRPSLLHGFFVTCRSPLPRRAFRCLCHYLCSFPCISF